MSHEQVPTVVIIRLETGETTISGVRCRMVVPHSCDNKAISAPSWGLAGWLGLSLAIRFDTADYTVLFVIVTQILL